MKKPPARAQLFVDDPAIAISGTQDFRDEVVAVAVMIWALHTKMHDFLTLVEVTMKKRTSSRSRTSGRWQGRRITSRRFCSCGSSLSELWRRRKSTRALLRGRKGSLRSTYLVSSHNNTGRTVKSVGDASIHGIGAYLMVDWKVIPSFASPVTKLDEQSLGICAGDHSSQQTTECLNLLVAPRSWTEHVDTRACVPRDTLPPDTFAVSFFCLGGRGGEGEG